MSDREQQIGERIRFTRTPEKLFVEISQQIPKRKELLFGVWMIGLFISFTAFIIYWLSSPSQSNDSIFFAIGAVFVAFFIVRYGKVFLWRKIGKERITIENDAVIIQNAFGERGKEQRFDAMHIKKFGIIPYDMAKFNQFMDRAFWEMGGETLGFEYRNLKIRFGKQLEDKEARQIARVLDKAMVEIPKRYRKQQKEG